MKCKASWSMRLLPCQSLDNTKAAFWSMSTKMRANGGDQGISGGPSHVGFSSGPSYAGFSSSIRTSNTLERCNWTRMIQGESLSVALGCAESDSRHSRVARGTAESQDSDSRRSEINSRQPRDCEQRLLASACQVCVSTQHLE